MIDRLQSKALLADLKKLLARVEADLLARSEDVDVPEIGAFLRSEYDRARAAKRTAATFGDWREDRIDQAAVAWVLSCVFVRFLEDNDLISPPRIAGPGERLTLARDSHQHFFMSHPRETDRDFLLSIFDELGKLPGTADIFGPHNALREIPTWLSGDAAKEILQFFQKIDANTGFLVHDFSDAAGSTHDAAAVDPGNPRRSLRSTEWPKAMEGFSHGQLDSRFLGDLYQDLSAYARSRYALLQTPHFIEQFLLERTLDPALAEYGLTENFKMIDPACGSGHLVLGSFQKILERWQKLEPATPVRELVRRTLESVHGIDINPFAVAIARFRLLLVAMRACHITKLADAPAFRIHIECGDSLLHTPLVGGVQELFDKGAKSEADEECEHAYASEDLLKVKALLRHGQYHAVMANPPYITPKDPGLRDRYRKRFATCHMKYSLAVPFMEHIFKLCTTGGFTGQITANSFKNASFGSRLVETFLPTVDLTHVIDTSGADIPGHETPTIILLGRRRAPVANTVRAVMGIRGEPTTPADPAKGLVWTAITGQVDQPGSQSDFVSVADTPRGTFSVHPWSIGGGGAAELKEVLEEGAADVLRDVAQTAIGVVTGEDDVYSAMRMDWMRPSVEPWLLGGFVEGDQVRDWVLGNISTALIPYRFPDLQPVISEKAKKRLWSHRTNLSNRKWFQKTQVQRGLQWWEFGTVSKTVGNTPLSIAFAFVATHNHFVLDRGGKVFKQTAPVIKLPADATEDDHIALLGILNSSTACFWMRQVCFPRGGFAAGQWEQRFNYNGSLLERLPLPASRPVDLAQQMQRLTDTIASLSPAAIIARWSLVDPTAPDAPQLWPTLKRALEEAEASWKSGQQQRIALQEEIDWSCYSLYSLLDADLTYGKPLPPISLGERPFEIALARRVAAGEVTTTWFERHGSTPITDIPAHWPADYRALIQKRLDGVESNPNIKLIEQPEYKRRWNSESWQDRQTNALERFLLDRLEQFFDHDGRMNDSGVPTATLPIGLVSIGDLATAARRDGLFIDAAEVFTGDVAFDVTALVAQLVDHESVPLLPVQRYKDTGLRKHAEWQGVWELQRQEDALDARAVLPAKHPQHLTPEQAQEKKQKDVGDIAVPPKYTSVDFLKNSFWSLRGKLDVPKERFVTFPGVTGPDGTAVIAWAGLDHLQLAKSIGDFYGMVQTEYGGSDDPRLVPLLANLSELLPWVKQWHPENLPDYGGAPAGFYEQFIRDEAASRGLTWADVRKWTPPAATRAKRAAKKAVKRATKKKPTEEDTVAEEQDQIA